jgi:NADPH:quinone reductase-like Zn-dependent oxidoreductase
MNSTMNAVYIKDRPEVGLLGDNVIIDRSLPSLNPSSIKPDQVLIKVKASSVNVDDLHLAEGAFLGGMPGMQTHQPTPTKPLVLGSDFAGVVEAVGSKVGGSFQVGQRVCGLNARMLGDAGTWADNTVSTAKDHVVPIPDHISFEEAAALLMPLHVIHALIEAAKLESDGKRVLIIGASGGIGSTLIPVLRHMYPNMYIVGVCSSRNIAFVKGLGANDVVDYTKGRIEDGLEKHSVDAVFDLIGGMEGHSSGKALLKPKGRYMTAVGPLEWLGERKLSGLEKVSWVLKILRNAMMNFIPGSHPYYHMVVPTELHSEFYQLIFQSEVRAHVAHTFQLEKNEIVKAIDYIQSHRTRGKIVLTMSEPHDEK